MPIGLELHQDSDLATVGDSGISQENPTPSDDPMDEFLSEPDEWHYFALGICLTVALIFFVLILAGVIH